MRRAYPGGFDESPALTVVARQAVRVFRPRSALVVMVGLAAIGLGCSGRSTCSCAAPFDGVFVKVAHPQAGYVVELCDGASCGTATVDPLAVDDSYAELRIPATQLGDWTTHRDAELVVTVLTAEGQRVSRVNAVAKKHHPQCCGDYWDVSV
jgi:hypothetical protein